MKEICHSGELFSSFQVFFQVLWSSKSPTFKHLAIWFRHNSGSWFFSIVLQFLGHFLQASFKCSILDFFGQMIFFVVVVYSPSALTPSKLEQQVLRARYLGLISILPAVRCGKQIRDGWMRSAIASSVICHPPNDIPRLAFLITYGSNDNFYFSVLM